MTTKRKPKAKLATKLDRATDRLYKAAAAYVKSRGGSLIVIGGVQVIHWPDDSAYKFTLGIRCLGTKPKNADEPVRRE